MHGWFVTKQKSASLARHPCQRLEHFKTLSSSSTFWNLKGFLRRCLASLWLLHDFDVHLRVRNLNLKVFYGKYPYCITNHKILSPWLTWVKRLQTLCLSLKIQSHHLILEWEPSIWALSYFQKASLIIACSNIRNQWQTTVCEVVVMQVSPFPPTLIPPLK